MKILNCNLTNRIFVTTKGARTANNKSFIMTLMALLIFLSSQQGFSQIERDANGNPVISQEYLDSNIKPLRFEKIEGGYLSLDDIRDKIVIIDFWQTWCGPCISGFKGLQKAKNEWPDKVEIIAASPDWADKKSKISRFISKNGYPFEFVWAKELEKDLAIKSIPYKIIVCPNGKLIDSISGSGGPESEYEFMKKLVNQYF